MIENNIWYNGSRKKLKFETFSGIFYLTDDKQISVDYIDNGEECKGYLNTIDISKIKPYIFDYRTDFKKIEGAKFKANWSDKIIEIDDNFKKYLEKDWNSWALKLPFNREQFIDEVLKPYGFKGYFNIEDDAGVKYNSIGIFVEYINELKLLNSERIELHSSSYWSDWVKRNT